MTFITNIKSTFYNFVSFDWQSRGRGFDSPRLHYSFLAFPLTLRTLHTLFYISYFYKTLLNSLQIFNLLGKLWIMPISTTIILDTRRQLKSGKYPVKLRVCDGVREKCRYHQINYANIKLTLTKEEWRQTQLERVKDPKIRELKKFFVEQEARATEIVQSFKLFTFDGFKTMWVGEKQATTLAELFEEKIEEVDSQGTKSQYRSTLKKIQSYSKRELLPQDITVYWLKRFEKFVDNDTSMGFYCRSLKHILNRAIEQKLMPGELMPFGNSITKYRIPASKNIKKALSLPELKKLFAYEAKKGTAEHFAINFFRLSFFLNGMNPADLFRLTQDNIQGNSIVFIRHKTRKTKKKVVPITAPYNQAVKDILSNIGPKYESPYLIDWLRPGMTEEEIHGKIKSRLGTVNRKLKDIAEACGIDEPVSMYYARHSLATILRDQGHTAAEIADMLGNSLRVVSDYFKQQSADKINEIYNNLNLEEGGRATDE